MIESGVLMFMMVYSLMLYKIDDLATYKMYMQFDLKEVLQQFEPLFSQQQMQLDTYLCAFQGILNDYLFNSQKAGNFTKIQSLAKNLTNFSKKTGFLDAAFYLLMHYDHKPEKILLMVTLIKDKFKYDFQNIEYFQIQNYYDRLCELALKMKYTHPPIFRQISMALAYIYLNLSSVQNIPLNQYLLPLIPKHTPPTKQQSYLYNYYFKVLEQIAGQIDNSKLVLDDDSREYARSQIIEHQQNVLSILNQKAAQLWHNNQVHKKNVFACFASWVELKYRREIFDNLPQHALMPLLFEYCMDYDNVQIAVNCLKSIINMIRNPKDTTSLIEYLGFNIVELIGTVEKYIRQKEIQDAEIYLELILQFCQKAVHIFTAPEPQVLAFLHKLVNFTKNKGFQIYKDFVNFWEEFVGQLIRNSDGDEYINSKFRGLLEDLYMAICSQCLFPSQIISRFQIRPQRDVVNQNSLASQIDERRDYSFELLELMAKLLGYQQYVRFVCIQISNLNQKDSLFWSYFEVFLFSLVTPLKKINFINQDLRLLVETYQIFYDANKQESPIAVKRIFLRLFRSLLNNQQKDRNLVQKIFFYSSTCFKVELLSHEADKTFCRGCELNGKLMVKDLPILIKTMQGYLDRQNIVLGVFYIICSSQQTIEQYLLSTLLIISNSISILPKGPERRETMNSLAAVTRMLKESKIIKKNLSIVKQFMRNIFPMVKSFLQDTQSTKQDENYQIEKTVKMLKNIMRCLGLQFWEFTPELCECVLNYFAVQPICSYLYLIEILITIFSKDIHYEQFILNLYCQFCQHTTNRLCNTTNIEKYNFLLDDFIGMNKRLFIYNAAIILKSNKLTTLIQKCLDYVGCKIPRIAKAAYTFFQTIFMAYWRPQFIENYNKEAENDSLAIYQQCDLHLYEQLKQELSDKIHYVVAKMLHHLSQNPVEMIHHCIFDALIAELKAFPEWNTDIWWQLIMPLPQDIFRQKQKQEFITYLNQMKQQDFSLVERSINALQKMLNLMGKRLASSSKRKDYYISD